jgi:hypothetical protein
LFNLYNLMIESSTWRTCNIPIPKLSHDLVIMHGTKKCIQGIKVFHYALKVYLNTLWQASRCASHNLRPL